MHRLIPSGADAEHSDMQDIAREPVDVAGEDQDEFMDTGVLHEGRVCTSCGEKASKGGRLCAGCKKAGKE